MGGVPGDVPASLDDIDRALIEHLRADGRMPNKRLAKHLSISEATVANRIRRLREESVLHVLLRRDLYSKGFDLQCFAEVSVLGRSVERVASDLVGIERATSVNLLLGTPEIMLVFNAVDREDLLASARERDRRGGRSGAGGTAHCHRHPQVQDGLRAAGVPVMKEPSAGEREGGPRRGNPSQARQPSAGEREGGPRRGNPSQEEEPSAGEREGEPLA